MELANWSSPLLWRGDGSPVSARCEEEAIPEEDAFPGADPPSSILSRSSNWLLLRVAGGRG